MNVFKVRKGTKKEDIECIDFLWGKRRYYSLRSESLVSSRTSFNTSFDSRRKKSI